MPKKPPALCMFCGNAPCTCDSLTQRKTSRKPVVRERPSSTVTPAESAISASVEDGSILFGETPTKERKFHQVEEEQRDLSFESALRVLLLSDILCPADAALVTAQLEVPKSQAVERRLADWRKRNGQKLVD